MNREKLPQISTLNREIEMLKRQLDRIECTIPCDIASDAVRGSAKSFPFVEHTIIITGPEYGTHRKKVARIRNQISKRIDELMNLVEEANNYIASIPDSEMRQILTMRYVEDKSWQEISAAFGFGGDGSTQRKKHDRFMKISLNS